MYTYVHMSCIRDIRVEMYEARLRDIEENNTQVYVKRINKYIEKLNSDTFFFKRMLDDFSETELKLGIEDEIAKTIEYNDKVVEDTINLYRKINRQNYEIFALKKQIRKLGGKNKTHKKKIVLKCKKNENTDFIFKLNCKK